jgi:predicted deacylase
MPVSLPIRGVRIGGVTVAPGEARAVAIRLAPRAGRGPDRDAARAIPAWVAVGTKAGPRISIVAAVRGTETGATAAALGLARGLTPTALAGSVVIVPVLRPGGRFAPRRRPATCWSFPGDAGGTARARDAFTVFSELVVGAGALLQLGAPPGGRRAALTAHGVLADPRVRRLAARSGALATLELAPPRRKRSLVAAAATADVVALELTAADTPGDETRAARALESGARALLAALGVLAPEAETATAATANIARPQVGRPVRVRAPVGGLVEAVAEPGVLVRAGATLARMAPLLTGRAVAVTAPVDALVLEAPARRAARKGTLLYVLAPVPQGTVTRRRARTAPEPGSQDGPTLDPPKLRTGWVEHVTLPDLAIARLKAKIDTGARTSALHVTRMRAVDTAGGPHRRPILEITVPGGGRGGKPQQVRAAVRGYVTVRDTSGRLERRPVIETALRLGPLRRRIAVTLTNRGDMLFPMLIGRTALGAGVVVDPARRYLLSR